jgi:hypothetical protein
MERPKVEVLNTSVFSLSFGLRLSRTSCLSRSRFTFEMQPE